MTKSVSEMTAAELRAEAKIFRATAAKNAAYPETAGTYERLAERYEELASSREANGEGTL